MFKTLEWTEAGVVLIDQRKLPSEEVYPVFRTYQEVAQAIKDMVVRGAPAIGVTAAMGIALGVKRIETADVASFEQQFLSICDTLAATRPTAINLFWAIERMKKVFYENFTDGGFARLKSALQDEALQMHQEDVE